jgi:hypothetical protein
MPLNTPRLIKTPANMPNKPRLAPGMQKNRWTTEHLYDEAVSDPERLRQMIELVQESKSNLYLQTIAGGPLRSYPAPTLPDNYTLLSADGSQIVPNRHRALQFGLINVVF